jgi:glucose-6-phosphate isomerase
MVIELDDVSPRELGAYMGLEMVSVMLLASLLDVNAFDQPAVEAYKEGTCWRLINK